jgi:hypothetical protein
VNPPGSQRAMRRRSSWLIAIAAAASAFVVANALEAALIHADGVSEAFEDGGDPIDLVAAIARASIAETPEEIACTLLDAARTPRGERLAPPDDQAVVACRIGD